MSRTPTGSELRAMTVSLSHPVMCDFCNADLGRAGVQTLAGVMAEVAAHKPLCPNWPSPRSRTAQCRPMAGQTAIPLPR